jgi:hypothetical protein
MVRKVEFSSSGNLHHVVLDGVDLSAGLRSASLTLSAGDLPLLELDPIVVEIDATYAGEAMVHVSDRAADLLISFGWTPPA